MKNYRLPLTGGNYATLGRQIYFFPASARARTVLNIMYERKKKSLSNGWPFCSRSKQTGCSINISICILDFLVFPIWMVGPIKWLLTIQKVDHLADRRLFTFQILDKLVIPNPHSSMTLLFYYLAPLQNDINVTVTMNEWMNETFIYLFSKNYYNEIQLGNTHAVHF